MVATSGDVLLEPDAIEALKRELFPLALLITPNLPEAARLLDTQRGCQRGRGRRAGEGAAGARVRSRAAQGRARQRRGGRRHPVRRHRHRALRAPARRHAPHARHGLHAVGRHRRPAGAGRGLREAVGRAKAFVWQALQDGRDARRRARQRARRSPLRHPQGATAGLTGGALAIASPCRGGRAFAQEEASPGRRSSPRYRAEIGSPHRRCARMRGETMKHLRVNDYDMAYIEVGQGHSAGVRAWLAGRFPHLVSGAGPLVAHAPRDRAEPAPFLSRAMGWIGRPVHDRAARLGPDPRSSSR